jgi:hypothetical protein
MRIASYLLALLEQIAKENNYTHFQASVLRENSAMIQVFKNRYPDLKISVQSGNEFLIEMDFADSINVHEPNS